MPNIEDHMKNDWSLFTHQTLTRARGPKVPTIPDLIRAIFLFLKRMAEIAVEVQEYDV